MNANYDVMIIMTSTLKWQIINTWINSWLLYSSSFYFYFFFYFLSSNKIYIYTHGTWNKIQICIYLFICMILVSVGWLFFFILCCYKLQNINPHFSFFFLSKFIIVSLFVSLVFSCSFVFFVYLFTKKDVKSITIWKIKKNKF